MSRGWLVLLACLRYESRIACYAVSRAVVGEAMSRPDESEVGRSIALAVNCACFLLGKVLAVRLRQTDVAIYILSCLVLMLSFERYFKC